MEDPSSVPEVRECQGAGVSAIAITKENVPGKPKGRKVDKSPESNGLHPRVLRMVAEDIIESLVMIFQESLDSGMVPEDWKIANVTPLSKKGGRQKKGNYWPVSLSSVVGKVLESIIKDEVMGYLETNDKISQSQHGFS